MKTEYVDTSRADVVVWKSEIIIKKSVKMHIIITFI